MQHILLAMGGGHDPGGSVPGSVPALWMRILITMPYYLRTVLAENGHKQGELVSVFQAQKTKQRW